MYVCMYVYIHTYIYVYIDVKCLRMSQLQDALSSVSSGKQKRRAMAKVFTSWTCHSRPGLNEPEVQGPR